MSAALPVHLNAIVVEKVKRHARDEADERWLMDVIGLVDEEGNTLPDDTNVYHMPPPDKGPGAKDPNGRTTASRDRSAVPEGLRNLAPEAAEEPVKKRRGPKPQPKVIRPSRPREVPQCGQYKAYSRHKRRGEEIDEACREAYREYHAQHSAEYRLRLRQEKERQRLAEAGVKNEQAIATLVELAR